MTSTNPTVGDYDVFISYSRRDIAFAEQLRDALGNAGRRVWIDIDKDCIPLTANWRQEMRRGIDAANNFLFIISHHSTASSPCREEIDYAVSQRKRLIPILFQEVVIDHVHPQLRDLNFVRFDTQAFGVAFQALNSTIDEDLDYIRGHTRLLQRAIEWRDRHYEDSFLLWGLDLEEAEIWLSAAIDKQPKPTQLQTDYVAKSRHVQQANQQAEIEREKRNRKRVTRALAWSLIGFVSTSILGTRAYQLKLIADRANMQSQFSAIEARFQQRLAVMGNIKAQIASFYAERAQQQEALARNEAEQRRQEAETARRLAEAAQLEAETRRQEAEQARVAEARQRQIADDKRREAEKNSLEAVHHWVASLASLAKALLGEQQDLDALLTAMHGALTLQHEQSQPGYDQFRHQLPNSTALKTAAVLQETLASARQVNRFDFHQDRVVTLRYSPNGQYLASGGAQADKTLVVWTRQGNQLWRHAHSREVREVQFSGDGRFLAAAYGDGLIQIWRSQGGLVQTLSHGDSVASIAFQPQGEYLAAVSPKGRLTLWNIQTAKPLLTTQLESVEPAKIRFDADGRTLIAAGARGSQGWVEQWHLQAQRLQKARGFGGATTMPAVELAPLKELAVSPNNHWTAAGQENGQVALWYKGRFVAVQNLRPELQLDRQRRVTALVFRDDSARLAVAHGDGMVTLLHLPPADEMAESSPLAEFERQQLRLDPGAITALDFSPQGELVTAGQDFAIHQWQLEQPAVAMHSQEILSVAFRADGRVFASGSFDGTVRLWQAATRQLLGELRLSGEEIKALAFHPERDLLAIAGSGGTVQLWAGDDRLVTHSVFGFGASSVEFRPHSNELAVANNSTGEIKTLRLQGRQLTTAHRLTHPAGANCVRYSPDGRLLASAGWDQTVKLWDAASGELRRTLVDYDLEAETSHSSGVNCIAFNEAGSLLASVGVADGSLKLWDVHTGQLRSTGMAHRGEIRSVAFIPGNDRFLVTAGADGMTRLWSVDAMLASGGSTTAVHSFKNHRPGGHAIAVSPDGTRVVSGGTDRQITLLDFRMENLLAQGCQHLSRYLQSDYFNTYQRQEFEAVYQYCQGS